jgi:hypothetical protein
MRIYPKTDNKFYQLASDGTEKEIGAGLKQIVPIGFHGAGATVPASSTYYFAPFISGLQSASYSSPIPLGGVIKNLFVRQAGTQPASGSLVITIWAGVDAASLVNTGISITFAANSAAQNYSNLVNTYTISAGHYIQLRVVNNATATSSVIGGVAFLLETSL